MADLLEEYKDGLRTGPQEIVALNKGTLVKILLDMKNDLKDAYQASSDDRTDKLICRVEGRLNTLLSVLVEEQPQRGGNG